MSYGLILAFDRHGPDFPHGVEVGRLWEALSANPDEPLEQTVHTANAEMCLRMGEALHRPVESVEHDETWMTVTFGAAEDESV